MKAMMFHDHGPVDNLRLEDVPVPDIGPSDALVRVAYCGANQLDIATMAGPPPDHIRELGGSDIELPHIPGSEVVGVVESVGESVTAIREGDRVAATWRMFCGSCLHCFAGDESLCLHGQRFGVNTNGGFAEYARIPAAILVPLPANVSLEQAAGVNLSGLLAWHSLFSRLRIRAAETVMIVGASGGTGTSAIQLAKFAGAFVIAVVRSEASGTVAKALGADVVIDSSTADVRREALQVTKGLGVDAVLDCVGAATFDLGFWSLARGGRWTTSSPLSGDNVTLNLYPFFQRQLNLVGSTGATRRELVQLLETIGRGAYRAVIWDVFPLEEAREALRSLTAPNRVGKPLLKVDDEAASESIRTLAQEGIGSA